MSSELHKAKMEVSKMESWFAEIVIALRTQEEHLQLNFERKEPYADDDMIRILVTRRLAREIVDHLGSDRKLFGL